MGKKGWTVMTDPQDPNYTMQDFQVDLAALGDTIEKVRGKSVEIGVEMDAIKSVLDGVHDNWSGPAYETYDPVKTWFQQTQHDVRGLLDEIIRRMRASYDNYLQVERANLQNVTPSGGSPPGSSADAPPPASGRSQV